MVCVGPTAFGHLGKVCGQPLALELAASRMKMVMAEDLPRRAAGLSRATGDR